MSGSFFQRSFTRMMLAAGAFRRDIAGIAVVEFAYLMPVMMIMLVGSLEISRAVSMDRKFGLVTALVADMIAREKTMSAAQVNAIYGIADHLMSPYDTNDGMLKVSITPVKANPANVNDTKVYAAATNRPGLRGGAAEKAKGAVYAMTPGLLEAGASAIVVETSFRFKPLFAGLVGYVHDGFGEITWTDKAVLAPRNSCVDFDGDNCVSNVF